MSLTKNLGQIAAIWIGVTPPSNTQLIWYDDNIGEKVHKFYNTVSSAWENIAVTTVPHNSLTGLQGGNSSERYHLTLLQYTNAITVAKNNYAGGAAPTITDNASTGYSIGSVWAYNGQVYILTSFTSTNANWQVVDLTLLSTQVKNNYAGAIDPATSDNATGGYAIGSAWINTVTPSLWRLIGFSGPNAIWYRIGRYNQDTALAEGTGNAITAAELVALRDGGAIVVKKVTIPYSAFSDPSMSKSVTAFVLAAGMVLHTVKIKHNQVFSGGAVASINVTLGIISDLSKYSAPFDLQQTVSGTNMYFNDSTESEDHNNPVNVLLNAVSTGDTLDHLTQGSVDIWYWTSIAI